MIYVEPTIRNGWRATAKRVFDVTIAVVALVATIPIVAVVAVANRVKSPGPVFFRQMRVGRDGQLFEIIKLRTMVVDAEARKAELMAHNESDGALFKIRNDPRVTPIGRLLRKLSLDELPQFWNVLRGEMSVVGPRPALPDEVAQWPADAHDRLRVLPGITGMWQVSGRSDTTFDEYKRLDMYYVDNWSLVHDLTIVAKTFGAVASSRGAS
jgi:lipopolysaccharide/colanic/teichoic acid biosynthesis glycosyltransferase